MNSDGAAPEAQWLSDLAKAAASGDRPMAETAEAVRERVREGDPAGARRLRAAAQTRAREALARGRDGEGLVWAELAAAAADVRTGAAERAQALVLVATAALGAGKTRRAGAALEQAGAFVDDPAVDAVTRANYARCLGLSAMAAGDTMAAAASLMDARERYRRLGLGPDAAACARDLGRVHAALGRGAEATSWLRTAASEFEALGRPLDGARVRYLLGHALLAGGEPELARGAFAVCREVFRLHGAFLLEAHATLSLAQAQYVLGRDIAAQALAGSAEARYERHGRAADVHRCRLLTAAMRIDRGDYAGADVLLRQARQVFEREGAVLDAARCLYLKGVSLREEGRVEQAAAFLSRAFARFRSLGAGLDAAKARLMLEQTAPDGAAVQPDAGGAEGAGTRLGAAGPSL
ncbi:MAG: hypothetical protein K6V73_03565 [Firmicutes bacterium]|nr:hypothetical protein [Bacillota bacterium]